MRRTIQAIGCGILVAAAGAAVAQPRIINLGFSGSNVGVSNPDGSGTVKILGADGTGTPRVFTLTTSALSSATFPGGTGVSLMTPDALYGLGTVSYTGILTGTQTVTNNSTTGFVDLTTGTWTRCAFPAAAPAYDVTSAATSSTSSGGTIMSPRAISANGRYIVGQTNVYLSSSGGPVSPAASFRFRPYIYDRVTNTTTILATPQSISTPARKRDGGGFAVANNGDVFGAFDYNASGTPPSGARRVIWYNNGGTWAPDAAVTAAGNNNWSGSVPSMQEGSADFGVGISGGFFINAAGTRIVGTTNDNKDINGVPLGGTTTRTFLARWDRPDTTSHTWTMTKLYDTTSSQNTATPGSISSWWAAVSCTGTAPYPDPQFLPFGASDDGNVIVGAVVYSTCGSFRRGGFIFFATGPDAGMHDVYDYLVSKGTIDIGNFNPVVSNQDPGTVNGISADGTVIFGAGGPQTALGPSWLVNLAVNGGPDLPVSITNNPSATATLTRCSSLIVNCGASGGGSLSYQWSKDGSPLSDGTQPDGSVITGANTLRMIVSQCRPGTAGSYTCTVTSSNGTSATSTACVASVTAALPNTTAATAAPIGEGTFTFNPCTIYVDDQMPVSCATVTATNAAWYMYTATVTGQVRIQTCNGSNDTVLTVFTPDGNSEVACSDDVAASSVAGCSATRSRVQMGVIAGQQYLVRVAVKAGANVSTSGGLAIVRIPANDLCADATDVSTPNQAPNGSVRRGVFAYDTTNANWEGVASCATSATTSPDVWFKFTSPVAGTLRADTCLASPATTPNTVVSIYNTCGGAELVCNDNAAAGQCSAAAVNQSVVSLAAAANNTYYIRVASNSNTTAVVGNLNISFTPTPCNAADIASVGTGLTGTGGRNPDGALTVDDLISFIGAFFAGNLQAGVADLVTVGGAPGADGQLTADDLIYFLSVFFSPCN
jgi:hypothetical protein